MSMAMLFQQTLQKTACALTYLVAKFTAKRGRVLIVALKLGFPETRSCTAVPQRRIIRPNRDLIPLWCCVERRKFTLGWVASACEAELHGIAGQAHRCTTTLG
jgi:hypothetical protein